MNSPVRIGSYSLHSYRGPRQVGRAWRIGQVINGMVYKIRTRISWRDLPECYAPWKTVGTRFRHYALGGVFTQALRQVQAPADKAGDIDWLVQIDSTVVRAHQYAATGRKGNQPRVGPVRCVQAAGGADRMLIADSAQFSPSCSLSGERGAARNSGGIRPDSASSTASVPVKAGRLWLRQEVWREADQLAHWD
ncbi:transposase [Streptomyces sp. NPDC094034]|uniref:transposase n=1 Tax=Streptomyces sp. NPDC094034 TaxID=3155309 RepID=UPI00332A6661